MSDIAAKAGVSSSTVSFVLNDRHTSARISEATREKVLRAADELGYRVNHHARAMRTANTRMVGIIGGNLSEEQVGCMLSGVLEEVNAQDYTLKILPAQGDEQQVVRRASELRLMGVVALHLSLQVVESLYTEAERYNYPVVLLDTRSPIEALTQVVSDDESGIAAGVNHLVELGHQRIAMISGSLNSPLTALREAAFRVAMERHHLELLPRAIVRGSFLEHALSVEAARALLKRPVAQRPTALFCASDRIALAALQVAGELELRVPHELSVVGFADLSFAALATPALTTIRQPFHDMGRVAVRRLLQASSDAAISETSPVKAPPSDALHSVVENPDADTFAGRREGNLELLPTHFIARHTTSRWH